MDKTTYILGLLPDFYNKEDYNSTIKAIVNSIAYEFNQFDGQITNVDNMVGVDTTTGTDLDSRWGNLLSLPRKSNEEDPVYINRLKTSVGGIVGGTAESIKYAIAVALRINDSDIINQCIQVYDAWEYTGGITGFDTTYGCNICIIDSNVSGLPYQTDLLTVIQDAVNNIKASGIKVQVFIVRLMWYTLDAENITWDALDTLAMTWDEFESWNPNA